MSPTLVSPAPHALAVVAQHGQAAAEAYFEGAMMQCVAHNDTAISVRLARAITHGATTVEARRDSARALRLDAHLMIAPASDCAVYE